MKGRTVPTGSFRDLAKSRIERDPAFATELLREAMGEPASLTEAILEIADGMQRAGVMDPETHNGITDRHSVKEAQEARGRRNFCD